MAVGIQVNKPLTSGVTLRIEDSESGFWNLSLVVGGAVQGSPIPVTKAEAFDFQQNLQGIYQASLSASNNHLVGASVGITRPLASGITLSIQNDPTLVGFWNMTFLSGNTVVAGPIAITKAEAGVLAGDLPKIYGLTLSH